LAVEIGEDRIKEQRRRRPVPIPPGGFVADYVPFYFAARSPMLYTISRGNVPAYQEGQDPLVYLVTEVRRLETRGCRFVFTDRNAYYQTAAYDPVQLDQVVDWPLMEGTMWKNTPGEPDRMERRMAEFLVHESVPFGAILRIGVRTAPVRQAVEALLGTMTDAPDVSIQPGWYY
jgi:hypothetical protein